MPKIYLMILFSTLCETISFGNRTLRKTKRLPCEIIKYLTQIASCFYVCCYHLLQLAEHLAFK